MYTDIISYATSYRLDGQVVLEGPIENVDAQIGTFTILGITVLTDQDTIYDDEQSALMINFLPTLSHQNG